ncbi:GM15466 [Drosophila sechellia]|uniref:GM15466 n=1 Tax=Drosophila sechellia TaxID=7238 RepID=B4IQR1_DROSE|nr:GM15466 [Drosophila sechellia]
MPRIVADNAPSEDDEDDDTATVDYEQELRREPKEDPSTGTAGKEEQGAGAGAGARRSEAAGPDGLEMLERAIRDALADTVAAASAYAAKFQAYAFLWTQQSGEVLAACMQTAREQTHHVSAGGYAIMETFKKEVGRKRQRKCPRGAECQQL